MSVKQPVAHDHGILDGHARHPRSLAHEPGLGLADDRIRLATGGGDERRHHGPGTSLEPIGMGKMGSRLVTAK